MDDANSKVITYYCGSRTRSGQNFSSFSNRFYAFIFHSIRYEITHCRNFVTSIAIYIELYTTIRVFVLIETWSDGRTAFERKQKEKERKKTNEKRNINFCLRGPPSYRSSIPIRIFRRTTRERGDVGSPICHNRVRSICTFYFRRFDVPG